MINFFFFYACFVYRDVLSPVCVCGMVRRVTVYIPPHTCVCVSVVCVFVFVCAFVCVECTCKHNIIM